MWRAVSDMLETGMVDHLRVHHRRIGCASMFIDAHIIAALPIIVVIIAAARLVGKVLGPFVFVRTAILCIR